MKIKKGDILAQVDGELYLCTSTYGKGGVVDNIVSLKFGTTVVDNEWVRAVESGAFSGSIKRTGINICDVVEGFENEN